MHTPPLSVSAQTAASPETPQPQPRLVRAAHEFEAAMMKELLSPLQPGKDSFEGDEDSGSSSALSSFAGEALGQAISTHGGFGVARQIIQQLTQPDSTTAQPPGNRIGNSGGTAHRIGLP
jgi:Rod binding domain-containing protein